MRLSLMTKDYRTFRPQATLTVRRCHIVPDRAEKTDVSATCFMEIGSSGKLKEYLSRRQHCHFFLMVQLP